LYGQVSAQMARFSAFPMSRLSLTRVSGRNKLLINHLGRLFVTSDAATIIREIEVVHPAAKLLVMASQAQESEVGRPVFVLYQVERC
jgi:TCP-1/cpn60 chaperonin family